MREEINNIIYDTDESKQLVALGYISTYYSYVDLYQTMDGKFFKHYQSHHPEDDYKLHERIEPISMEDAQDFIVAALDREVCMLSGTITDKFLDGLLEKFKKL